MVKEPRPWFSDRVTLDPLTVPVNAELLFEIDSGLELSAPPSFCCRLLAGCP